MRPRSSHGKLAAAAGGRRTRAGLGACPHDHFPYDVFRGCASADPRSRQGRDSGQPGLASGFPIVRWKSVTAACSLTDAVGMPTLGVTERTLLTRWWLWIFGIDDRFDDFRLAEPRTGGTDRAIRGKPAARAAPDRRRSHARRLRVDSPDRK